MSSFVGDGWDRDDGFIEAAKAGQSGERLYDELSFCYRPATRAEWIKLDAAMTAANDEADPDSAVKVELMACKFVTDHVRTWTLKNRGVHAVPVTAENAMRMHNILFQRLYKIVRGHELSDKKPDAELPPPSDGELLGNSEAASG